MNAAFGEIHAEKKFELDLRNQQKVFDGQFMPSKKKLVNSSVWSIFFIWLNIFIYFCFSSFFKDTELLNNQNQNQNNSNIKLDANEESPVSNCTKQPAQNHLQPLSVNSTEYFSLRDEYAEIKCHIQQMEDGINDYFE